MKMKGTVVSTIMTDANKMSRINDAVAIIIITTIINNNKYEIIIMSIPFRQYHKCDGP